RRAAPDSRHLRQARHQLREDRLGAPAGRRHRAARAARRAAAADRYRPRRQEQMPRGLRCAAGRRRQLGSAAALSRSRLAGDCRRRAPCYEAAPMGERMAEGMHHSAGRRSTMALAVLALALCGGAEAGAAEADDAAAAPGADAVWSLHFQSTAIGQGYPGFHSPFAGKNSLPGGGEVRETLSATAFLGRRLWQGGALYFNPEAQQGFAIGRTVGIAGFPNGEGGKAGFDTPKPNVARLFLRQTFGLGGASETVADDANHLAGTVDVSRVTVTAGKFAVTDIFDDNQYAHDPRTTFLNWSLWEAGAWDYPADQKGYTDGVAVELNQQGWALRGGWFLKPKIANDRDLETRFWRAFGAVTEVETRHE